MDIEVVVLKVYFKSCKVDVENDLYESVIKLIHLYMVKEV